MDKEKKSKNNIPNKNTKGIKLITLPKNYSSSRELRNKAEKQRRDIMSYYVSELASLVPFVVRAQKKVDKTSILRLAASYIRMHKILCTGEIKEKSLPVSLLNTRSSRSLLNSIGGFLMVLTNLGKVIYVSEAIEDTFGYSQADILGQTIYSLIHRDDVKLVEQKLNTPDSTRCSFYCRLLEKSTLRNDPGRYEIIHVVGQLKPLPDTNRPPQPPRKRTNSDSSENQMNVSDNEEDKRCDMFVNRTGTHMLIALVQVVRDKPITELTWVESMRDEYITRHRMDGKISYVDHRISFITGLMPEEVRGKSAFDYMHSEDILWSIIAQKMMLESAKGQGVVTYRLQCRDGSFVSLHSRGFLEVNKETGKVDTFICINTVLGSKDAEAEVKEQRKPLLPIISQSANDLIQSFSQELPPDLAVLVRKLITNTSLEEMQKSIDDEVNCDDGQMGKKLKLIELDDDDPVPSTSGINSNNNSSRTAAISQSMSTNHDSSSYVSPPPTTAHKRPTKGNRRVKGQKKMKSPPVERQECQFTDLSRFPPPETSVEMSESRFPPPPETSLEMSEDEQISNEFKGLLENGDNLPNAEDVSKRLASPPLTTNSPLTNHVRPVLAISGGKYPAVVDAHHQFVQDINVQNSSTTYSAFHRNDYIDLSYERETCYDYNSLSLLGQSSSYFAEPKKSAAEVFFANLESSPYITLESRGLGGATP